MRTLTFDERMLQVCKTTKPKTARHAAAVLVIVIVGYLLLAFGVPSFSNAAPAASSMSTLEALDSAPEGAVSMAFGGDVILGRHVKDAAAHDPSSLLGDAHHLFAHADVGMANLETAILTDPAPEDKAPGRSIYFDAPPGMLDHVSALDVVAMANNHMADYGRQSASSTLNHLETAGITATGGGLNRGEAYAPHFETIGETTIAFVSFTDILSHDLGATRDEAGVAVFNVRRALPAVRRAADSADLVVVNIHWGIEYMTDPTTRQKEIAASLATSGADIIVGHHPHVLQPATMVEGALVSYSLGNLVSDQGWTDTTETVVPTVVFDPDTRVANVFFEPFHITNARPRLLRGGMGYYQQRLQRKILRGSSLTFAPTSSGFHAEVQL